MNSPSPAPSPKLEIQPPSPDSLLLDAWRRAEQAQSTISSAVAPPPPPQPVFGAVDRVLADALKVQAARAEARADAQAAITHEQRQRTISVEAELEAERSVSARLREELLRLKSRHHATESKAEALTRALRDAQAEVEALLQQNEYWHNACARAVEARDTAVRAAIAGVTLNELAFSDDDGGATALLRAQLRAENNLRLQAAGLRVDSEPEGEASPLAKRVQALEQVVQSLNVAASPPPAATKAAGARAGAAKQTPPPKARSR